jgi:hypothetical protein
VSMSQQGGMGLNRVTRIACDELGGLRTTNQKE